jgi:XTP/dITP diphosphohydrolase
MTTLLIATRNAHKVGEIRAILSDAFTYLTLNDVPGAPKVVEDADTFAGNAAKKAMELARWTNGESLGSGVQVLGSRFKEPGSSVWVLADDSGLEVDALQSAPGVHSARFAAGDRGVGGNSSDAENNAKLLRLLEQVPAEKRTARFRCVLALVNVGSIAGGTGSARLFDGACEGRIGFGPRGHGGFGYDPLFLPDGFEQSFAELGEAVKNQMSHRAKALNKLREFLSSGVPPKA